MRAEANAEMGETISIIILAELVRTIVNTILVLEISASSDTLEGSANLRETQDHAFVEKSVDFVILLTIFSSAFALWANAELYTLVLSLTVCLSGWLSVSLPPSGRKLEITVNIDARTMKFCMRHHWTQSLRFRENQIFCMSVSLLVALLPY